MESRLNPICKYCQSPSVIKWGQVNGIPRFFCKACQRKFVSPDTIPMMQTPTKVIADCLNMYYEGMSLNDIRRNLIQQDQNFVSTGSIYNWVCRFTDLAVKEADTRFPKVGDIWIADETYVRVDRRKKGDSEVENPYSKAKKAKWVIFWDIIDADTRFLLASHITTTRGTQDAKALMDKAAHRAGKVPRVVVTDKLAAYLDGIELSFGRDAKHKQGGPFDIENNTNLIERFHGTLKERTKVMRALKNRSTLKQFTDGWLVHYNFFRPHMSLNDRTPAGVAGIDFPFRNWQDLVQQPYEKTARIPIRPVASETAEPTPPITRRKPLPRKNIRITKRVPRITPPVSLSTLRRH